MAVKVISKGPDENVAKQIVCQNCGATLEYVPNDVKRRDGEDMGGGPDGEKWIDCLECKKKVIIESW